MCTWQAISENYDCCSKALIFIHHVNADGPIEVYVCVRMRAHVCACFCVCAHVGYPIDILKTKLFQQ